MSRSDIDMQEISSIHGKIIELEWEDAEMKSVLSAVTHWRLSSDTEMRIFITFNIVGLFTPSD